MKNGIESMQEMFTIMHQSLYIYHRETRLTVDFCSFCYLVIYSIFVLNQPPVIFRDSIVLRSELPLPRSEGKETAKERAKREEKGKDKGRNIAEVVSLCSAYT